MKFPVQEIKTGTERYPKLLSEIADPPRTLYCRGNIDLLNTTCFSVVGTRKITGYGKEAAQFIIGGLAETGWTIVSGLALGVDAVAHQAALDNDLPTIAVLGSTVSDQGIGPRTNLPLAKTILENSGLLISEYHSEKEVTRANFAIRDRIISGLSIGVLVVEGAEKSGSLVTAKSAADQNRDVFAVPGNIFSPVSKGPNDLIKKGAKAVTSANDILEEYGENLKLNLEKKTSISTKDPIQKKILDILDERGESTIDQLIGLTEVGVSEIMSSLSMLEIKNKIKNRGGKYSLE